MRGADGSWRGGAERLAEERVWWRCDLKGACDDVNDVEASWARHLRYGSRRLQAWVLEERRTTLFVSVLFRCVLAWESSVVRYDEGKVGRYEHHQRCMYNKFSDRRDGGLLG